MADQGLGESWARAMEANARYYDAWGTLTSAWLRELAEASTQLWMPNLVSLVPQQQPQHREPAPPPRPAPAKAALVLEGAAEQEATGAFLVENTLRHPVEQEVEAVGFTDVTLTLTPATLSLAPGEQAVVRVSTIVPPDLDTECRGTVRVAGVPGAEIIAVVRRI